MIIGDLREVERYYCLHPRMKEVFEYVASHDFRDATTGRIVLDGEKLFINLDEVELKDREEQVLEVHRRYIDVQIPLDLEEIFGWSALANLGEADVPYSDEKDFAFYRQQAEVYVPVKPGQFIIFFPEDAHAPLIGKGRQRKLIVKVLV